MPTVLLILPSATYRAAEFIDAANDLGASVVIGSDVAPVFEPGTSGTFLQLDLSDPQAAAQAIVDLDKTVPIDAVVGVDDQGLLTAAVAGDALGLVTNPVAAVAATRNKAVMRELLASGEVHQPRYRTILRDADGIEDAVEEAAGELGYPVVIKPTNQAASRGVIRANNAVEAKTAARRITEMLDLDGEGNEAPLLVEGFVAGAEISIEGLLSEGALQVLAVFDKPDPLDGPYFEETIYVTPSRHDPEVLEASAALVEQASRAMGLVTGPIHAEVRLSIEDNAVRPVVLEVAARTIGGRCAQALSFSKGRSLEAIVLEHALMRTLSDDAHRSFGASGVMMLPIPASGRLIDVSNKERALAVPGITALEISIAPGKEIQALPEGNRYLGFLFAKAATPAKVESALRSAHGELKVEIEEHPHEQFRIGIA